MDDGKLKVKKGDMIHISIWGAHYDPELYPDPHTFDPERLDNDFLYKQYFRANM